MGELIYLVEHQKKRLHPMHTYVALAILIYAGAVLARHSRGGRTDLPRWAPEEAPGD